MNAPVIPSAPAVNLMKRLSLVFLLVTVVVSLPACRKDSGTEKQAFLASGNTYAGQGKLAEATIEYRKALQLDSRFGEAHYRLGLAYDRLRDRPNALRELLLASDLLPERDEVQLKAGQYLLFAGRFDEARKVAMRLVDRNRRSVDAQLLLANALGGLNQLDAAAEQVEQAIETEPTRESAYTNLAAIQLAQGSPDKAENAFRNAIRIDARSIEARVGLANLLWAQGRRAEAEALLKEAIGIAPTGPLANRTLAALYLSSGRTPEAEAPLKVVAEAHKEALAPRLALADYYLGAKREAEGLRLLESVAAQPGGLAAATARLADYEYRTGRQASAHARVDKLTAAEPKNPLGFLMKAAFLTAEGKPDQALEKAKTAAGVAPRLARAQYTIGMIHLSRRAPEDAAAAFAEAVKRSPRFGAASLELAKLLLREGRTDEAIERATDATRDLPDSAEARYVLVRALMQAGQRGRAQRELQPLLALGARLPRVQTLAGLLAVQAGQREAGRKAFEQALKLDPGETEAISALVGLDLETGRPAEARRRVEARVAAAPRDLASLAMAARLYDTLGLAREAEQAWQRVLQVNVNYVGAYEALARLYLREGRPERALGECQRMLQRQPKSVAAHTLTGVVLEAQGQKAAAQGHYQQALELDPQAVMAANNLAWLLAESGGDLDLALQLARRAQAQAHDSPEVADTVGWVAYKKGLSDLAVASLAQAVRLAPGRATYRYHLGMACLKANDWSRAKVSLEQALRLQADFPGADEARKVLATLR